VIPASVRVPVESAYVPARCVVCRRRAAAGLRRDGGGHSGTGQGDREAV